jgi:hypothetical protein
MEPVTVSGEESQVKPAEQQLTPSDLAAAAAAMAAKDQAVVMSAETAATTLASAASEGPMAKSPQELVEDQAAGQAVTSAVAAGTAVTAAAGSQAGLKTFSIQPTNILGK